MKFGIGAYDPAAEDLRQAAERFTKTVFIVPSLRFQSAVTFRTDKGDQLLCRWSFDEPFGKGTLILDDTPELSNYHWRLSNASVARADGPKKLAAALLFMNQVPLRIEPDQTDYRIDGNPASPSGFSWGFSPLIPSPYGFLDFELFGLASGADWYLTVNLGKAWTTNYYPVPPFVPERFPPITALMKEWSRERLRTELNRPYPESPKSLQRITILLNEWASRGMTPEEIVELLGDVVTMKVESGWWIGQVLRAVEKSGKPVPITAYFGKALHRYEEIGKGSEESVGALFSRAGLRGCKLEDQAEAIRLLRDEVFIRGPLRYLGACSRSQQAFDLIERLQVNVRVKRDQEADISRYT
ncbi:MAG: hypothetical protein ABI972_32295 [Acidobacteriota bacterium]